MTAAVRRREDWPARLDAAIAARARTRFRWGRGRHDCIAAAVALIRAMTGADLAAGFAYATRTEADALMAAHGGVRGLAGEVAAAHGLQAVAPAFAQRGDPAVVRVPLPDGTEADALGVVDLSGRFVRAPARVGWALVPRAAIAAAWRIEA